MIFPNIGGVEHVPLHPRAEAVAVSTDLVPAHVEVVVAVVVAVRVRRMRTAGRERDGELTLVAVHPGVEVGEVQAATGWDLRIAPDVTTTKLPTDAELDALRALEAKGRP